MVNRRRTSWRGLEVVQSCPWRAPPQPCRASAQGARARTAPTPRPRLSRCGLRLSVLGHRRRRHRRGARCGLGLSVASARRCHLRRRGILASGPPRGGTTRTKAASQSSSDASARAATAAGPWCAHHPCSHTGLRTPQGSLPSHHYTLGAWSESRAGLLGLRERRLPSPLPPTRPRQRPLGELSR